MKNPAASPFRALRSFNFRVWTAGALVSNIGTWMQRIAQDWLVLTQLTHHDASALGIVMALQFAPQLLLLPWTGFAADHFNQRKLLIVTQAAMGVLALALGALTVLGAVQLWHVYVFAFVFGSAAALDAPVRQTFVAEQVGDDDLPSAVSLNSTSFNAARMVGPAAAGIVIAKVGTGWAFLMNGISFAAVLISMTLFRTEQHNQNSAEVRPGPYITNSGSESICGTRGPCVGTHFSGAIAPGYWWFAGALVVVGVAALILTNNTNSMMQLSTEPAMRGRVMALRLAVALGTTPIGAPIVGWVANHFGPRWALGIGAASGFAAAIVALCVMGRTVLGPELSELAGSSPARR
jgi:MFS family permease